MVESIVAGVFGLLCALVGYLVEQRYGRRLDALEAAAHEHERRLDALDGVLDE